MSLGVLRSLTELVHERSSRTGIEERSGRSFSEHPGNEHPELPVASRPDQNKADGRKTIDKNSIEYVLRLGLCGGISGLAAKTLIAPMDRIKILFQTLNPEFLQYRGLLKGLVQAGRKIWASSGFLGLFQGHLVTLLRIFPYAAIKFVAYEQIRSVVIPSDKYETAARRFMAGLLSGLASVLFTYPLDLVRVRLAFETKNFPSAATHGRLWRIMCQIYNEAVPQRPLDPRWWLYTRLHLPPTVLHVANFYRGFGPTILGMIPYAGVSFYTHDLIHDVFRSPKLAPYLVAPALAPNTTRVIKRSKEGENVTSRDLRRPLKAYAQLVAGGLAGMCSQTAAYPFEVIRRRMQVGGVVNHGRFLSFRQTAKLVFQELGLKGFYVGLLIGYIKVVPMVACSFFVYERCKAFMGI